jgi:four helix bundle protein
MRDFRKYSIWIDAVNIANQVYDKTSLFPSKETYGLSNQLERAAVSISSNIAEGASRTSPTEYAHFLEIAIGSAFEVETQLTIAVQRNYMPIDQYNDLISQLQSIERRINSLINKLRANG